MISIVREGVSNFRHRTGSEAKSAEQLCASDDVLARALEAPVVEHSGYFDARRAKRRNDVDGVLKRLLVPVRTAQTLNGMIAPESPPIGDGRRSEHEGKHSMLASGRNTLCARRVGSIIGNERFIHESHRQRGDSLRPDPVSTRLLRFELLPVGRERQALTCLAVQASPVGSIRSRSPAASLSCCYTVCTRELRSPRRALHRATEGRRGR